jgi:Late competence development protein ComFB
MLTQRYTSLEEDTDFIHNFYERRVIEAIYQQSERVRNGDRNFLADVACVALNRLPPRYIRYDVDMTFFTSPQEMLEIEEKINKAVEYALEYVMKRSEAANETKQ